MQTLIRLLNKTGREVCEGQQLDMDFEKNASISLSEYMHMIELKTAVLLAGSLQMGAIAAGAEQTDQELIYDFGRNLGLAFQVQDDWLDAFGDPSTFGKLKGGDIVANKKTFLLVKAMESASPERKTGTDRTADIFRSRQNRSGNLYLPGIGSRTGSSGSEELLYGQKPIRVWIEFRCLRKEKTLGNSRNICLSRKHKFSVVNVEGYKM